MMRSECLHHDGGVTAPKVSKLGMVTLWFEDVLRGERADLVAHLERRHETVLQRLEAIIARIDEGAPLEATAIVPYRSEKTAASAREAPEAVLQTAPAPHRGEEQTHEAPRPKLNRKGTAAFAKQDNSARPQTMADVVTHPVWEAFFLFLIVMSSLEGAFEMQYWGYGIGHGLDVPAGVEMARETWPHAELAFSVLRPFFGFVFTVEVTIKLVFLRVSFFRSYFNIYDLVVICVWLLDYASIITAIVSPTVIRLVRLSRFMKIVKLLQFMQGLDHLHLITASIIGSIPILIWSTFLLTAIMIICALVLNFAVQSFLEDEENSEADRVEVFKFFGTFTRSMLSMYEITLGNWIPTCRTMMERVNEWYSFFFIVYKCVVGFAVVKVITGVFLHETFKVASSDDELMIIEKERMSRKHMKKMGLLFAEADDSGDGKVGWTEFKAILEEPRVKTWLSAMELDVRDTRALFDMLDDGDHEIALEELAHGVSRLKGPSRSLDMVSLMNDVKAQKDRLKTVAMDTDMQACLAETCEVRRTLVGLQDMLRELPGMQTQRGTPARGRSDRAIHASPRTPPDSGVGWSMDGTHSSPVLSNEVTDRGRDTQRSPHLRSVSSQSLPPVVNRPASIESQRSRQASASRAVGSARGSDLDPNRRFGSRLNV